MSWIVPRYGLSQALNTGTWLSWPCSYLCCLHFQTPHGDKKAAYNPRPISSYIKPHRISTHLAQQTWQKSYGILWTLNGSWIYAWNNHCGWEGAMLRSPKQANLSPHPMGFNFNFLRWWGSGSWKKCGVGRRGWALESKSCGREF